MSEKTIIQEISAKEEEKETRDFRNLFLEYLKEKKLILTILLSMFVLLDIIGVIISANYLFKELFLYLGIIMVLFAVGISYIVVSEKNYFWAILSSVIIGLLPTIEIIIHLATIKLEGADLGVTILALILSICGIIFPTLVIYLLAIRNIKNESSLEKE
ncbi:MAG TPA: hypothetical protein VMX55_12610 [candidate division Zixibacteria bacterium]|nr:hypothetical protein [candidate division Zixibacteria bacterium]